MTGLRVGPLIERAAASLRAAGVAKPRREAHRLWAWQNRLEPGTAYLDRERPAEAERVRSFEAAVDRRVRGEPLAYVLGYTGFRRLELRCDRRALIPRPETEGVVDLALARRREGSVLDLGTGTGCLALALAEEGGFSRIVGVDCSPGALALAAENRAAIGLPIELLRSDLGAALRGEQFDLLVTNPPYLSGSELAALDPSVRDWEPAVALLGGGEDGLGVTGRILRETAGLLRPGGWLVMEVDSSRAALAAQLAEASGWRELVLEHDLFGRARYLAARRSHRRGGGA